VLDWGRGFLCRVDGKSGKAEQVAFCPGFARSLSFWRGYALVGTSLPRDGEPRCGAYIVDTRNGDILHWIRFEGAVRELFDAAFIPGVRAPMCVGLANPEMRTLITLSGEASGSTAEAVA
jgi:uncharacterized protein (TIGR03032 family)